jgi:HEAT repeat protein
VALAVAFPHPSVAPRGGRPAGHGSAVGPVHAPRAGEPPGRRPQSTARKNDVGAEPPRPDPGTSSTGVQFTVGPDTAVIPRVPRSWSWSISTRSPRPGELVAAPVPVDGTGHDADVDRPLRPRRVVSADPCPPPRPSRTPYYCATVLARLRSVPWADLEHAYGSAFDVPRDLRALRSRRSAVRANARWRLESTIFHQGGRFEASAYAVPFLLELLADPAVPEREEILELLALLAVGYDEEWLPDGFPVGDHRREAAGGEEVLRAAPPCRVGRPGTGPTARFAYWMSLDAERMLRAGTHIELRVYDEVRAGAPLFRALLRADDRRLRVRAAYLLGWFVEDAAETVPVLRTATGDPDVVVAAVALVALGLLGDAGPGGRIAETALDHDDDVVRWAAAVALARLRGADAGPRVSAQLRSWTTRGAERHSEIPYLDGDLGGHAALALRQLGDGEADAGFDALLARLGSPGSPTLTPLGEALLSAFPDGPVPAGTAFAALDRRQQRLVRVLADSPGVWGLVDVSLVLRQYGLPDGIGAMRAWTG